MAKAGFYAVAKGRVPGIYASWGDCETQVKGYAGARYKKFKTQREAEEFIAVQSSTSTALVPSSSRSRLLPVPISRSMSQQLKSDNASAKPKVEVSRKAAGVDEQGFDVVYADGACKGNGQAGSVAGVGVWWGHNDQRNIAERCPGAQTNNRAELIAIVRVLETTPFVRPIIIKTDSTYSIKCLQEWHQNWAHRGWKTSTGKPVLNAPLIKYLLSLLSLRQVHGLPVKFVYVKGHAGIEGNEGADAMANLGAGMPEEPEREWDYERGRIDDLINEVRETLSAEEEPELVDKGVQVEIENGDEIPMDDSIELGVDDVAPNGKTPAYTSTAPSSDSVQAPIAEPSPRPTPPTIQNGTSNASKPPSDAEAKSKLGAAKNAEAQTHAADNLNVINYVEFDIEDFLGPEELEAELAEAEKT